jgi:cytoskeleton protein RodZ
MAKSMSNNEKQTAHEQDVLQAPDAALQVIETNVDASAESTGMMAGIEDAASSATALLSPEPEPEPEPELPAQLPGELLAARREEMRLSVDEVSTRLKLASRQILALEENDFAQLPGMATVRGFIRSYAKLLELDPEPLIALVATRKDPAVDSVVARRPLPSPGFSGRRYSPPARHRSAARRLSGLAAVILIFVSSLAYIAFRNDWWSLPAIDVAETIRALTPAVPMIASDTAAATAKAPEMAPPVEPGVPAVALTPESALQLRANQDAWVEVIAVDGERKLVSKLMKAGTTELVEITEPVVLVVGNAAGIEAALRGHALNLRAAARDNVAKLSLK